MQESLGSMARRFCDSQKRCADCPINGFKGCVISVFSGYREETDEQIAMVQRWAEEHPVMRKISVDCKKCGSHYNLEFPTNHPGRYCIVCGNWLDMEENKDERSE